MNSELTFVITSMGRTNCLKRVLESLRREFRDVGIIVGIQDDRLKSDMAKILEPYNAGYILTGFDSGLSFTRNRLFEKSNTDFVFLLDDDFVFESSNGVESSLNMIKSDGEIGIIGGRLFDRDSKGVRERNYEYKISLDLKKKSLYLKTIRNKSKSDVDIVLNFGIFRRSLFVDNDIKWDENIKINGEHEDFYLNYKKKSNKRIIYNAELVAFHEREISEEYSKFRYRTDGYDYFRTKWDVKNIIVGEKYVQQLFHPYSKLTITSRHSKGSKKIMNKMQRIYSIYEKEGVVGLFNFLRIKLGKIVAGPASNLSSAAYVFNEVKSYLPHDRKELKKFKNKYSGQRCFIIGNGPSLNKIDLSKLEGEISFGVNGIFYKYDELGFTPDFYMVEDSHVINDNIERIKSFKPKKHKFFPTDYKPKIGKSADTSFFRMNHGFYDKKSAYFQVPRFSTDFSEVAYCGQSVTMINIQLAYYMGFTEVYLIGMDFSYTIPDSAIVNKGNITSTEDDVNHFHPDYFGKGKKWHDPLLSQVLKTYEAFGLYFRQSDRKIINATVGGNLEVFERVDFNELFDE